MSDVTLGKLETVDPRLLWISEPANFTPWLASNLATLGDALGLELELIQAESSVGPFACDIEARDLNTGRKVIIENQLEATDHTHLGQLVTYAAGLDATVIVWISPQVREQHRQAIDFLNRHTVDGLDFFAVALEVVKIGASLPAVVFRLAASPNAWAKTVASANQTAGANAKGQAYQQFFQKIIDDLRITHHFTNAKAAQPQNWYSFSSGTKGFLYSVSFNNKAMLRAELYIDVGDDRNKLIFDYFETSKAQLEQEMGESLMWERLDNKRACRISAVLHNTPIEVAGASDSDAQAWAVSRVLKIRNVFGPHLAAAVVAATAMRQSRIVAYHSASSDD